jgi:hypothetical protein
VTVSKVNGISHNGGISDETADDQRGDGSPLRPLCPSVGARTLEQIRRRQFGRILLGEEELAVFQEALRDFGSGNFVMMRVGLKAVGKIRESVISEQRC